jgi:BCCT family betaine/carnitine transporter
MGLDKGIRILANLNAVLAIVFLAFVLVAGPTVFILDISMNSLGLLLDNLFRMSFWTDPIVNSSFPEDWTVFYWGWWIAYAPMVGLFIARISRGRTIREVIIGQVIWGSLGCMAFFAIAGGYSLHAELNGIVDLSALLDESGIPAAAVAIVGNLPGGTFTLAVYTVLCIIFLATTLDSAAYVLASISTKNLTGDEQPARWNRFAWAFALAITAVGLIAAGGLNTVQTSTVIAALPLFPVLVILQLSLLKWLRRDFGKTFRSANFALEHLPDGSTEVKQV